MTNPTVGSAIPQASALQSLLWVSSDTAGGAGAWDAKNSTFWPIIPVSTGFTSVACGTSGVNGLSAPTGQAELIALDSTNNPASNPWNLSGLNWTIFLQFRANVNTATNLLLNRDYQGYNTGGGGYYIWWLPGGYLQLTSEAAAPSNFGTTNSAGGACPVGQMTNAFIVCNNGVISFYIYGTYSNGGYGTAGSTHLTFANASPAVRVPCLFSQPVASGGTTKAVELYIAACWNTALTPAEMQSFGANEAAVLSGSSYAKAFNGLVTVADTTAPTLTGTITTSAVTSTSYTLAWPAGSDDTAVTGYEYSLDGGTSYASAGNVLTVGVTGRTPGATDSVRVRAKDAAGNASTPLSTSVTLASVADTTAPVFSGTITVTSVTTSGYNLAWPAGSDNIAVTGYEYSLNGGTSYTSAGNVLTVAVTGRTAGATDSVRVRAKDAAGNVSTPLSTSVTLATVADTTAPTLTGTITTSAVTSTSYTLAWPAGSDNVGVTYYECSLDGGTTYTNLGNVLTTGVSGRTPGATDAIRVRARDSAGNASTPLSTSVTLAAAAPAPSPSPAPSPTGVVPILIGVTLTGIPFFIP